MYKPIRLISMCIFVLMMLVTPTCKQNKDIRATYDATGKWKFTFQAPIFSRILGTHLEVTLEFRSDLGIYYTNAIGDTFQTGKWQKIGEKEIEFYITWTYDTIQNIACKGKFTDNKNMAGMNMKLLQPSLPEGHLKGNSWQGIKL
jgi:hypothetical protein